MYKVIVIDDETWICKLIHNIVDWNEMGFEIIADAGNGLHALQMITEQKPDLVITDIRMPGLDGIGLIKSVREKEFDTEFIIISGYNDFEYARSAVTYDAFGYLLKPLGKDEFQEMLLKLKEKLNKKEALKSKIEYGQAKLLEQDIKKIINNIAQNASEEELNRNYGLNFREDLFRIAILKQDQKVKDQLQPNLFHYLLEQTKQKFKDYFHELLFIQGNSPSEIIMLLNYQRENSSQVYNLMNEIITAYENDEELNKGFKLTIGLGKTVEMIKDIESSYMDAVNSIKARVTLENATIIDAEKEQKKIEEVKNIIDLREEKRLTTLFEVFDFDGAAVEISRLFYKTENEYKGNAIVCHQIALEIIQILFTTMNRKGISTKNSQSMQKALEGVDDCTSKNEMERYILQIFKKFIDAQEEERLSNSDKIINEIKIYIAENYMEDISLEDVARRVCLNPNYVSESFKKKTGENFSEYLISYRIEMAKDLLKDIKYKVVDVSEMVGYKDPKYFSRLFRKKVGVNPTDYRNYYL